MLRARGTWRADAPCAVLATGMRMGVERGGLTPARWTEAAHRVPCLKKNGELVPAVVDQLLVRGLILEEVRPEGARV